MAYWSEAAARNQAPILEKLRQLLDPGRQYKVLEIGSGTGQHAIHFTGHLPNIIWQTSDLADNHLAINSNLENCSGAFVSRLLTPVALDSHTLGASRYACDIIYTANTLHIMSWAQAQELIVHVGQLLKACGLFVVYGPFMVGNQPTSDSNYRFDQYLSQSNPRQGVRNREDVAWLADEQGLSMTHCFAMPSNNQLLVFEKRSARFC